jgi:hypothetical protein
MMPSVDAHNQQVGLDFGRDPNNVRTRRTKD